MENVEVVVSQGVELCYVITDAEPDATEFVTRPEHKQQVGFVVYPAGGEVARHTHVALQREIVGTSEVLVLRSGRCLIDIYDESRTLVATRELKPRDVVLMLNGGHGFRMIEDTVFLEVKQGPYTGIDEKERF